MSKYTKIKMVLVIALAILISYGIYNYLKSLKEEITIIVAAVDINERECITPEMLREVGIRKREKEILAANAFTTISELNNAVSLKKIKKGSPIYKDIDVVAGTKQELIDKKVITSDGQINQTYFVSDNKRILTVRTDSQGAVANSLKIGDYVDVIFTSNGDSNESFSTVILKHILIYDIEKLKSEKGDSLQNISLSLTPQQAVDLTYAKRNGKIDFVLNPVNGENELVYPTNMKKIIDMNLNLKK